MFRKGLSLETRLFGKLMEVIGEGLRVRSAKAGYVVPPRFHDE